jgi:polyisoprenyl-teichoic acid--peptidoglycan teichoic acid transferase
MSRKTTGRSAQRTVSSRKKRPAAKARPARRRPSYSAREIDRYNVVDRDIYSHSSKQHKKRRRRKKGGCLKKLFTLLFVLVLIVAAGGFLYFHILSSRLNRSDVTSSQLEEYVQLPSDAPAWNVISDNSVMNILLLGVDENEDGSDGRSDTNILMSIDSEEKTIRLVSFLRDSYLEIPTVGKNKLNAAYAKGGVALTMQTLENNYRINIDRFVSVNFDNFAAVIDKMGGLDVPMSAAACEAENKALGTHLKPGVNHLNGELCLYYARIRYATDDFGSNDYGRTARQRQVIELMIQKMKSMNFLSANKIIYDYLPYVKTNLTNSELLYLARIGTSLSDYEMENMQMPAPNTFDDSVFIDGVGNVISLDLEENCTILREFLYGDNDSSNSSD